MSGRSKPFRGSLSVNDVAELPLNTDLPLSTALHAGSGANAADLRINEQELRERVWKEFKDNCAR